MRPSTRRSWLSKVRQYTVGTGYGKTASLPLAKEYRGAFNQYPCTMTIDDLATNMVTLVPGVYITSTRCCGMGTIRKTLHDLQDNFWDRLKLCGARKHIITSGYTQSIAFCHWVSSLYNEKLVMAFCQMTQDTLTITLSDDCIKCCALKIKACTAKNLLDILACVALASGLVPKGQIGDACVEVDTMDIDRFSVSLTVHLCPSYIEAVKIDEAHLSSMYGHLVAEFQ